LIQGESGTGKELVARALHYQSPRRRHPFVPVNCAAMPEGLLESELFGHAKGAFTGAQMARRGLFLEASRGTLFLDEIGDMPLGMQAKLLRVLEQRQIRPVGSDREVVVDVRILAATHRDLASAVQQGTFREDLYYRLRVMPVQVPPLRDHREDIPLLAETFVQRHVAAHALGPRRFTPQALRVLEQYDWPGNVRQLSHVIERAVTLSTGEWIEAEEFGLEEMPPLTPHAAAPETARAQPVLDLPPDEPFNLDAVTRHLLVRALEKTRGHKGQAADLLGVHPRTLTRMMHRFAIPED
jgi:transcriptional regulator with GAF, ATPase, and Fis domain